MTGSLERMFWSACFHEEMVLTVTTKDFKSSVNSRNGGLLLQKNIVFNMFFSLPFY